MEIGNLKEVVNSILVEGIDYGKTEFSSKNCLYKTGAEKLVKYYNLNTKYEVVNSITQEGGHIVFLVKCILSKNDFTCEGLSAYSTSEDDTIDYNKAIKMAQKRALVSAVLGAVAGSELFTQDLDEWKVKTNNHTKGNNMINNLSDNLQYTIDKIEKADDNLKKEIIQKALKWVKLLDNEKDYLKNKYKMYIM